MQPNEEHERLLRNSLTVLPMPQSTIEERALEALLDS